MSRHYKKYKNLFFQTQPREFQNSSKYTKTDVISYSNNTGNWSKILLSNFSYHVCVNLKHWCRRGREQAHFLASLWGQSTKSQGVHFFGFYCFKITSFLIGCSYVILLLFSRGSQPGNRSPLVGREGWQKGCKGRNFNPN